MAVQIDAFDPLSESLAERHWEQLAELRECPVGKTELYGGIWLISKYDEVMKAARDWQTFSSANGSAAVPLQTGGAVKLMPISTDPPIQRDLRRLIDRHFGPKQMAAAEPEIRQGAVDLLERFQENGACDFVAQFAVPYPANSFFRTAFGVEPDDTGRVMKWMEHILTAPNEAAESVQAFFSWTQGLLDQRRRDGDRDDVLGSLLVGTIEGRPLTDAERSMVIMNLIIGGVETTTHALSNAVYYLATMPELRERLKSDRGLIPAAVEEFLRFEAPSDARGREVTCPVIVGGAEIHANERVALFYSAANRDPEKYEHPDQIVVDRFAGRANPHLSFGAGPHRCPGAHLARLEIVVTIDEVLDRLDDLQLASDDVRYSAGLTRGLISLPITFTPKRIDHLTPVTTDV